MQDIGVEIKKKNLAQPNVHSHLNYSMHNIKLKLYAKRVLAVRE